jgi:hypothetical protein
MIASDSGLRQVQMAGRLGLTLREYQARSAFTTTFTSRYYGLAVTKSWRLLGGGVEGLPSRAHAGQSAVSLEGGDVGWCGWCASWPRSA